MSCMTSTQSVPLGHNYMVIIFPFCYHSSATGGGFLGGVVLTVGSPLIFTVQPDFMKCFLRMCVVMRDFLARSHISSHISLWWDVMIPPSLSTWSEKRITWPCNCCSSRAGPDDLCYIWGIFCPSITAPQHMSRWWWRELLRAVRVLWTRRRWRASVAIISLNTDVNFSPTLWVFHRCISVHTSQRICAWYLNMNSTRPWGGAMRGIVATQYSIQFPWVVQFGSRRDIPYYLVGRLVTAQSSVFSSAPLIKIACTHLTLCQIASTLLK